MKFGLKRYSAFLLTMAVLVNLLGAISAQATEAGGSGVTIDVRSYFEGSHEVNGIKEATTAVVRALDYAKTLGEDVQKTIYFPQGEYHFYADYAPVRELYVSNTVGSDQNHKNKYIAILVEDMKNVTIDGGGSTFVYHGDITSFAAIRSANVKFTNFEAVHASPSVVDVTVESKVSGENAIVAYVPSAYTYTISGTTITWKGEVGPVTKQPYWQGTNTLAYTQIYDTISGKTWRGGNTLFSSVRAIEDLGGGRLKFTYNSSTTPQVGLCFQMRNTTRTTPGVFIWESENVTMKGINIRFLHGFGVVGQLSKDITVDDVNFLATAGRTTAGFADFLQMSSIGGKVTIKNCDFSNPHDDPINIHGTFLTVYSVSADKKTFGLQYRHPETAGFPQYYVGDTVDFQAKGTMKPVADSTRTVAAVNNFPGGDKSKIEITLDRPVEGIVGDNESHVVENVTYTPEVEISNNRFIETPTRGILVTTRRPIVIENNYFDAMGMASIFISCDAAGWYESGHTEDVIIRNNVFDRLVSTTTSNNNAILIEPTGGSDPNFQLHKKIVIENNIFNIEDNDIAVVNAKSVAELTVRGNTINRSNPDVTMTLGAASQTVQIGSTQVTTLSKSGAQLNRKLYRLENCKNVTFENNLYDGGLNQGVDVSAGTTSNDITVSGDDLRISGDNQRPAVDKVLYFSTDPAVATVDANGIVKGISKGTAEIFAYTVSGARVFESNRLSFTVSSEGASVEKPTSIAVTAPQDKIDVGGTLQFTAVVAPAEMEQTVIWSVRDATDGTATDVASITAEGLLTAAKPGVVEVVATSAADGVSNSSKLLTVRAPDGGKGEHWTIDREVTGKWVVNEDGTLTITAQSGGDWDTGNGARNLFLTDMPEGNFEFTVELRNKTSGAGDSWDEAGLIVFKDADNYVALERKNGGGNATVAVSTELNGRPDEGTPVPDVSNTTILLKLARENGSFTGSYSVDNGGNWVEVRQGVVNNNLANAKIGVIACNAPRNNAFTFADFKIGTRQVPFKSTNREPEASGAAISTQGGILTLDYIFTDPDSGDSEGSSRFFWYAADSINGLYRRIEGANAKTFTTTTAHNGKYIMAAVAPVDALGRIGAPVYAAGVAAPEVTGDLTDATLHTLEIPGVTLSPAFQSGVTAYSAVVPAAAGTLTVNAQASQMAANVVVGQTGSEITVTVTAPNGVETKTYTVSLTCAKNSDSALETLNLTGGAAALSLEGDTRYYQLLVDSAVEALTLETETVSPDTEQEVRFNYQPLENFAGTAQLSLKGGLNYLEIRTLAADGISTRIYRVVIIKTPSSEAELASLEVNGIPVAGFESEKDTYQLDVQAGSATFNAVPKSAKAKVEYLLDGVAVSGPVELSAHLSTLKVKVTAENASTVRIYTIYLVIPAPSSADIITFATDGIALNPAFDPAVSAYFAETVGNALPISIQAVEQKALVTVETAAFFARGNGIVDCVVPLRDGENSVKVTVTSPDSTVKKEYTITVTKSNAVYLSDLDWVSGVAGDGDRIPKKDSAWEGRPMSVANADGSEANFAKGIGVHADSTIVYDLTGKGYETFTAKIGASYSQKALEQNYTNVVFTVICDGVTKHTSAAMKKDTPYVDLSIDVRGVNELTLLVTQSPNQYNAHGNWADAKLTASPQSPAEQFSVTVAEAENAAVWTNRKTAEAGQTVTVQIDEIEAGYRFSSLTVSGADGTEIDTVAVVEGSTYTFAMPAQAVTVTAALEGGTPPCDHNMTHHAAVPATCTEDGNVEYWNCSICNKNFSSAAGSAGTELATTVEAALGHNYGEWSVTKEATCTEAGEETRVCNRNASHVDTQAIAMLEHSYGSDWKSDTDNHWHECTLCHTAKTEVAEHISGGPATEDTAETCTVCDYIITPATGHTEHTAGTEWLSDGDEHWNKCTGCNERMNIAAHSGGTANCTAKAVCEVCGQSYGELEAHDYSVWAYSSAQHWKECSVCATVDESTRTNHVWELNSETSTEAEKHYSCVCGATKTEATDPPGLDKTPIDSAITVANTVKLGISVNDNDPSYVSSGTRFVNTEVMAALNTAIDSANAAKESVETEAEVQAAALALHNAIATFANAIRTGTFVAPSYTPPPSNTITDTEKNEDGSTTTTVTDKTTGTVTETTTMPNGDKVVVETKKDGTVTEKVKNKDGYQSETETKPDGSFTSKTTDQNGVKTETTATAGGETTAKVTLPKGTESAVVSVPVKQKPTAGTVAVLVRSDGTEEIIRTSVVTEDGVRFTVEDDAEIKLIDNSKSFVDVADNAWYSNAVQFAASRELFQGNGKDSFNPAGNMTHRMLVTVLARLDGQDTTGGDTWYSKAVDWGVELGITDGSNADTSTTRESLAVMLYRYAKAEKVEADLSSFPDGASVSSWAANAMRWATANGIITGSSEDLLNPTGTVTRAEVATMLQRFVVLLSK